MNQKRVKVGAIFLLSLYILIKIVLSNEETEEDTDYGINSFGNNSESEDSFNATDEYDYNDEEEHDSSEELKLVEKVKLLHQEGRNISITKHVQNINQTFDIFNNIAKTIRTLLPIDQRNGYEFLEFLTEIDLGLSHQCMGGILKILSSLRNRDLWALRCKSKDF